jgi:hypothetical protein
MKHPQDEELVWRCQILSLLDRDLDNKKPYNANFNGECDICNEKIKVGEIFYFIGEKERMCSRCKLKIKDYLESVIGKFSTAWNDARTSTKFVAPN